MVKEEKVLLLNKKEEEMKEQSDTRSE